MTEFAGSEAIGGVKVMVELDETPYQKGLSNLKSRIAKNEGMPRLAMASTAQQQFAARWNMMNGGGDGGGNGRPPGGYARAQWGPPGAGGNGTGAAPGPGGSRQRSNQGFNRNVDLSNNFGRLAGTYGIAHTAEAIMAFETATIQTTRSMKAAFNDSQRIAAMIEQRRAGEAALSQVPLIGAGLVAARRLADTFQGNSQADIDRETMEGERDRKFSDDNFNRAQARKLKAAELRSDTAKLFMGPGGSMSASLAVIETRRQIRQSQIADDADARLREYTPEDRPDPTEFSKYGILGANNPAYKQDVQDWQGKDQQIRNARQTIAHGRAEDFKQNNQQAKVDELNYFLGGRRIAQQFNPADQALSFGSVRLGGSMSGQDPAVIAALMRIADKSNNIANNTSQTPPPVVPRF